MPNAAGGHLMQLAVLKKSPPYAAGGLEKLYPVQLVIKEKSCAQCSCEERSCAQCSWRFCLAGGLNF